MHVWMDVSENKILNCVIADFKRILGLGVETCVKKCNTPIFPKYTLREIWSFEPSEFLKWTLNLVHHLY